MHIAEAQTQTQTLVQTQAHGVHMHAGRTDTDTCAQSTDACRCSVAMVKLGVVRFIGKGSSRDNAWWAWAQSRAQAQTQAQALVQAQAQAQARCKVAGAAGADRQRRWHRHWHTGTYAGMGTDAGTCTGTGTGTGKEGEAEGTQQRRRGRQKALAEALARVKGTGTEQTGWMQLCRQGAARHGAIAADVEIEARWCAGPKLGHGLAAVVPRHLAGQCAGQPHACVHRGRHARVGKVVARTRNGLHVDGRHRTSSHPRTCQTSRCRVHAERSGVVPHGGFGIVGCPQHGPLRVLGVGRCVDAVVD